MTEIRDPIHGYVKLDDSAMAVIKTPQMQRLRWIKQLGLASLVYPGANHSRFEHSLGVYHLTMLLAERLSLEEEEKLKLCFAALLHDVGHGPLSHATEPLLSMYERGGHEKIIGILRQKELLSVIEEYGQNPHEIQRLIMGDGALGQIINGEIDSDRMDYLIRDAHYTGVAFGVIDHLRLIEKMRIHSGRVVLESGGLQAAESLLVSRLLMHPTVYFHHVCRIAECMIIGGLRQMIEEEGVDPMAVKRMDDMELFANMSSAGGFPGEMIDRIKSRRLFKRAIYVGHESLERPLPVTGGKETRIAEEIAEAAGVDPRYVLVDIPPQPLVPEGDFPILVDGEIKALRKVSPLVTILERAHHSSWRFGVYTTEEERERVKLASRRCLNLKKDAVQHTLPDI